MPQHWIGNSVRAALAGLALAGAGLTATDAAAGPKPESVGARDLTCLALSVYHEARNQPLQGQLAVAHVVLNRLEESRRPATICGIVYKSGEFSWTHFDSARQQPTDETAWEIARAVAEAALAAPDDDPVGGSTFFHAVWVSPSWASAMVRVARIGDHVFYVCPPKTSAGPFVHLAE